VGLRSAIIAKHRDGKHAAEIARELGCAASYARTVINAHRRAVAKIIKRSANNELGERGRG
jgi:DNA-directed RNA polymerase specialized sigma24 family protein